MTTRVRSLATIEIDALPPVISQCLDLSRVEIHKRRWTPLTPQRITVVRGHKIFYPSDPGPIDNVYHLAHLVHEMVHVFQYLHMGVGLYSPRWIDRRYHYRLEDGKRFSAFGLEQQAAMFEDFFRVGNGLTYRWAQGEPTLSDLTETLQTCADDYGPKVA